MEGTHHRKPALSLKELIVLIIGIVILLGLMIVPMVSSILRQKADCKTMARVYQLDEAINAYYMDTNRMYYPGQQYLMDGGTFGAAGKPTATEWLARSMFNSKVGKNTTREQIRDAATLPGGNAGYVPYSEDMFTNGTGLVIADCYPDSMPILYFPSHLVTDADKPGFDQFNKDDNRPLFEGCDSGRTFKEFIRDPRDSTKPAHDGGFLLIAPGPDRKYFTDDDSRNW